MLTGTGKQRILRRSFEAKRNLYLLNATGLSESEREYYQLNFEDGRNRFNPLRFLKEAQVICEKSYCKLKYVDIRNIPVLAFV